MQWNQHTLSQLRFYETTEACRRNATWGAGINSGNRWEEVGAEIVTKFPGGSDSKESVCNAGDSGVQFN